MNHAGHVRDGGHVGDGGHLRDDGPVRGGGARETGPKRTCVACREEGDRDDLVRLVRSPDGALVVDYAAKLPGRGAWIHPAKACVDLAMSRSGLLSRALDGDVDASVLRDRLMTAVHAALRNGLSQAAAAGALMGGFDVLTTAIGDGRVVDLVFACDCSDRTRRDILEKAGSLPEVTVPLDRETLGRSVGSGPRAALGVASSRAATHLRKQLRRLRALG